MTWLDCALVGKFLPISLDKPRNFCYTCGYDQSTIDDYRGRKGHWG